MSFRTYIEEKIKESKKANIEEVRKEIDQPWVNEKIEKKCIAYDGLFSADEIKQKILTDDLIASFFAKDPLKQNIAEKECSIWIGVKKLPASGKNCIRFNNNGEIVSTKSAGGSKSADFKVKDIYYTQKYTGDNTGGAQDNQYDDVVTFLINGSKNYKVGAIVDGAYWDDFGNRNKLKEQFKDNPNVSIVSADDLK